MNLTLKRIIDCIISILGLIILAIPMGIIAILIKLDSKGPVIFKHERVGKDGKIFLIYKFRTMTEDAQMIGPPLTEKNDTRITRIGKILRRTSLDELPELINVLKGQMSIVGPRPEIPSIVATYTDWQKRVLRVRPGITGFSQIHGRAEREIPSKLRLDNYYIKHQSLKLDLWIMLKTISVVITGKGAY
jgi:lipopolysaccharide/colanic/teichoic acid biosynthesis glycosyltransferase